jgi:hypothetical protein
VPELLGNQETAMNHRKTRGILLGIAWTLMLGAAWAQNVDSGVYLPPQYQTLTPPPAGRSYTDPVFGTNILRVTDALAQRNSDTGGYLTFITDEYSTMSPFNNDGSRFLLVFQSYFALYDPAGNFVKECPLEVNSGSEPRWSRTSPDVLYYIRGNQLKQYNTATDAVSVVHTFGEYSKIGGNGESDICFDGNHFILAGDKRYIFVYDLSSDRTGPVLDAGGRRFDSLYITPNDNVTVTWLAAGAARWAGIELFDRDMVFQRQLSTVGGHMDVTRDINGDEVLVLTNSADPAATCDNAIVKVRLSDGQRTCLLSLDWSLAVHISAPDGNGWCFVETYAPGDPLSQPGWTTYTGEILQVKLDGSQVRRIAHHRSRPFNSYNYQPHVAVSRDGTRLVYSSNFGLQASLGYPAEYSDVYLVSLSAPTYGNGGGTGVDTGGNGGAKTTRIEQDDAAVAYSGDWFRNSMTVHSGGSAKLAMDPGARATLSFTGTAVRWLGYADEWSGIANVYLDGEFKAVVNTLNSPSRAQAVLWEISGLKAGTHTLAIEATGTRNPSSGGAWVWIDAFEITK